MSEKKTGSRTVPMVNRSGSSEAAASKKPAANERLAELEVENAKLRAELDEARCSLAALQKRLG